MKKKTAIIIGAVTLALIVAAGVGIGRAYAYFTSYVQASGKRQIFLGDSSSINEEYKDWQKSIVITNDSGSDNAVFVRVKAFAGSEYVLNYDYDPGLWFEETDGGETWYVYKGVLSPGESTQDPMIVQIFGADGVNTPVLEEGKSINVVVVYETTPAIEDGSAETGYEPYNITVWDRGLTAQETETVEAVEGGE